MPTEKNGTKASVFYKKISHPIVCGNQTYPYGQVGALSPDSRFLIEPLGSSPQRGGLQSTGERRAPVD